MRTTQKPQGISRPPGQSGRQRASTCSCEPLEDRTMLSGTTSFRPPSVPLVAVDPYLSVWSDATNLTDDVTRHWTGAPNALVSLIRIDGVSYRLMGNDPSSLPAMPQVNLQVLPTQTIYDFDNGHVHVTLTFLTPKVPSDLNLFSLPLTYLNWSVSSVDGQSHSVQFYDSTISFSASAMIESLDAGVFRSSVANDSPERVDSRKPRSFIRSKSAIVSRRPRIW